MSSYLEKFYATLTSTNTSYFAVIPVWLLAHASGTRGVMRRVGYTSNVNPREQIAIAEKDGKLSPRLLAKIKRREASHLNAMEGLPLFLGGLVAGNTAGLSPKWMNFMSWGYLISRIAYTYLYINVTEQNKSWYRSGAWWVGNLLYLSTYVMAGYVFAKTPNVMAAAINT